MPTPTDLDAVVADDVKAYFGIPLTDTSKDTQITATLPLIASFIREYCRQDFLPISRTEYPDIEHSEGKFLTDFRPVVSVTSLTENDIALTEGTDFSVRNATGTVEKIKDEQNVFSDANGFGYWSSKPKKVKIIYVGGETAPADVIMVMYEMVGIRTGLKTRTFSDNDGVETVLTLTSMPAELKEVLDRHQYYRGL